MTDLKPLAKSMIFASVYGAGRTKIGNVDFITSASPKYNARMLGSWADMNEILDFDYDTPGGDKLLKLRLLKEDIEFNLPILQSGMDRLASGLDGVSDADRKKRVAALTTLHHQLEEAYAEWARTLDDLGITTVD